MPGVPHRFCARHVFTNFIKQWKGMHLRNLFWACAKSTTSTEFDKNMEEIKRVDIKAWEWLSRFQPSRWSRSGYSTFTKNYNMTNNMCEQFNAKIAKYRGLPAISMMEEIRCYIMRKMNKERQLQVGYIGPITPHVQKVCSFSYIYCSLCCH